MFPNTISILIATGDTLILNRVNQDSYGSEYQFADATRAASMKIRHSKDSPDKDGLTMKRHNVFFEYVVYPTPTSLLKKFTYTGTLRHGQYDDPALCASIAKGVEAWVSSGSVAADLAAGKN
nr:MAG: hypothetical protein 2 [Leviviridae sp.]